MIVADEKRFLSWLSQLHETEPVIPQSDNRPSARFIFDGIPIEKQIPDANLNPQRLPPQARRWQQTHLELKDPGKACLSRPTTKGTESGMSRIERNGYKRIPRAKTKEDRYEYKGKSSVKNNGSVTVQTRKSSRQKRKHTINEDFQASNVPPSRLTLHPATNLGIFNRGKRSSPIKTRVLDQGFSETEFLSKTPIGVQANYLIQHEKANLLEYDIGIENSGQSHRETEPQPPAENIALNFDDTAIRHALDEQAETSDILLFCYGKEKKSPSDKPMIYSPMKQESRSAADIIAEPNTMGLLDFKMHSSKENVTENPAKVYWTLEDLKSIMQQRISSWKSEDEDSTTTSGSWLQTGSRKRKQKHTSSSQDKKNTHAKLSKRRRTQGYGQRSEIDPSDRSTSPRTAALDPCSFTGSCIDFPFGKPLPTHAQIDYAVEGNSFQPQHPCPYRGVGFVHDEDASFIHEALDAAYEAIMRSEPDAPLNALECVPKIKTTTSSNDGNVPLHAHWEWGLKDEETLSLSHIGQETLLAGQEASEMAIYTTASGHYERHRSYFGEPCASQKALLPMEKVSSMDSGQVQEWKGLEANRSDFVTIDPMKNFWRQNKLY